VERRAPRGLDHGACLMMLGIFHWMGGEWSAAEARVQGGMEVARAVDPDNDDVANALGNLGMVANSRGDLARAEEYFGLALRSFQRSGTQDPLAVSRTLNNLSSSASTRGDLESAIRYNREVLALRERLVPDSIDLATSLLSLGEHLVEAGHAAEAQGHLERALRLQRVHAPASGDVARTLVMLAEVRRRRGDAAGAEPLAEEALATAVRTDPRSVGEAQALRTLAELHAERGRLDEADRLLARSAALLTTLVPGTLEQARSLYALGRVQRSAGRRAAALEALRGAAAALDQQLTMLGGTDEVRARFRESWRHVHRDLAELQLEMGLKDEAFETLERARARAFLMLLRARAVSLAGALPPAAETERRAIAAAYKGVQERLATRVAAGDEPAVKALSAERRQLQLRRDQIAERLGRQAAHISAVEAVADADGVRSALRGAAALSYFVGEERTRLAVVGPRGELEILDLAVGESELRDVVERFRFLLEARTPAAHPAVLGAELYRRLVAPAERLLAGAEFLLVVPDGPLHRLPFAALPGRDASGRNTFLVERTPVMVAASISAWMELRRAPSRASGGFVAFADPDVADEARLARRARRARLPRLPYSRVEASRAAGLFGSSARVLAGSAATEPAARRAGEESRVLHFATHAFADPVSPLDSALVLAPPAGASVGSDDGLLEAWEVVQDLRLGAELVTLSACETGSGAIVAEEGLLGLTRAFHFAGAGAVLASLWEISDRSTEELMGRFYSHWLAGQPKVNALRSAQLELIHAGALPAQWAAFQLHGDGR
jgi:CHAT domain-containing protein/Tfp pilus assembly protein PilF